MQLKNTLQSRLDAAACSGSVLKRKRFILLLAKQVALELSPPKGLMAGRANCRDQALFQAVVSTSPQTSSRFLSSLVS